MLEPKWRKLIDKKGTDRGQLRAMMLELREKKAFELYQGMLQEVVNDAKARLCVTVSESNMVHHNECVGRLKAYEEGLALPETFVEHCEKYWNK